jgi:hypothetical protein
MPPQEAEVFRAAGSDRELLERMERLWQQDDSRHFHYPSDKAWDALHRALTDGTLEADISSRYYPLSHAVLGGTNLYKATGWIIAYVAANEVQDVALALARLSDEEFKDRYYRIDPDAYLCPVDEVDFEITLEAFRGVRAFFQRAALGGLAVLFTAPQ